MMTTDPTADERVWTIPNGVTALRLLGLPVLLWAAHEDRRGLFLLVVLTVLLTDWLDGKLASILNQRTNLGARLDSGADAFMYAAIAVSFWWLEGDLIQEHMAWMLGVLGSWVASAGIALVRFFRIPSYHLWSAKLAWLVTAVTVFLLLLTESTFLLPWALGLVIFSNLHAIAVTFTLPRWEADVWSLRRAWRIRQGEGGGS